MIVILGAETTSPIHVLPGVEVVHLGVIVNVYASVTEKGTGGPETRIVNAIEIGRRRKIKIERDDVKM